MKTSSARPTKEQVEVLLPGFIGDVNQRSRRNSRRFKIDGARAYDLARDGTQFEIKPRQVYIETLEMTAHNPDKTTFRCRCGKGTYIRSLARDMGRILGCFGYISRLERTEVGPFTLENAISLDIFTDPVQIPEPSDVLLPLWTALDDIPVLALQDNEVAQVKNGGALSFVSKADLDRMSRSGIDWGSRLCPDGPCDLWTATRLPSWKSRVRMFTRFAYFNV